MAMKIMDIAFHSLSEFPAELLEKTRLSPKTLIVAQDAPAREIALHLSDETFSVVLLTDPTGTPRGLVSSEWILSQCRRYTQRNPANLVDLVDQLEMDPAEQARGFHHEWLNFEHPELVWCESCHCLHTEPCP
jgi:hypothetical protein